MTSLTIFAYIILLLFALIQLAVAIYLSKLLHQITRLIVHVRGITRTYFPYGTEETKKDAPSGFVGFQKGWDEDLEGRD